MEEKLDYLKQLGALTAGAALVILTAGAFYTVLGASTIIALNHLGFTSIALGLTYEGFVNAAMAGALIIIAELSVGRRGA